MILTCYGFAQLLVSEELAPEELPNIIIPFVIRICTFCVRVNKNTKKSTRNSYRSE